MAVFSIIYAECQIFNKVFIAKLTFLYFNCIKKELQNYNN